jgi:arylsulfatase A-like enzyme
VLLVVVDDLRPQLGCYNVSVCGGQKMVTPNVDSLSERGLLFRHHYNQYSVCSPSRNSFMSGRRPDSTLTYNFKDDFRHAPGGELMISLPEYFKTHGYNTTGCGKTYHAGKPANFDEPRSWTEGVPYRGYNQGLGFCGEHCACALAANDTAHFTDDGIAARAIELMTSHKQHNIKPWFIGVGFIRPHVDWSAPQRFWDLYPEAACATDVAKIKTAPPTAPLIAWVDGGYVDKKSADLGKNYTFSPTVPVPDAVASHWRRGYYAAVSYMDWNVGKVLDAVDELGFTNDTVISFHSDHGYQLGEHAMWEKYTNWELAARVPWILSDPSAPASHGRSTKALTENVDIYPTLAAAAGLPAPAAGAGDPGALVEGDSAAPLLSDPAREWKNAAFSQYARCDKDEATGVYKRCSGDPMESIQAMGYSARTQDWRYTEWFAFDNATSKADMSVTLAVELYDHAADEGDDMDAYDQVNVGGDPENAAVVKQLAQVVRDGWAKHRPPAAPAAPAAH